MATAISTCLNASLVALFPAVLQSFRQLYSTFSDSWRPPLCSACSTVLLPWPYRGGFRPPLFVDVPILVATTAALPALSRAVRRLEGAKDWAVSRNRFWGTPMPMWVSEDGEEMVAVGSIAELKELSGVEVSDGGVFWPLWRRSGGEGGGGNQRQPRIVSRVHHDQDDGTRVSN